MSIILFVWNVFSDFLCQFKLSNGQKCNNLLYNIHDKRLLFEDYNVTNFNSLRNDKVNSSSKKKNFINTFFLIYTRALYANVCNVVAKIKGINL